MDDKEIVTQIYLSFFNLKTKIYIFVPVQKYEIKLLVKVALRLLAKLCLLWRL